MNKLLTLLCYCWWLLCPSLPALADTSQEEIYRFERIWPLLKQPWYFQNVEELAISQQGHLYVAHFNTNRDLDTDTLGYSIKKFDLHGHFISEFGTTPSDCLPKGGIWEIRDIAADSQSQVYVLYFNRQDSDKILDPRTKMTAVCKFSASGQDLTPKDWLTDPSWSQGLTSIALDHQDNIYLHAFDTLKQFSPTGKLLNEWPVRGSRYSTMAISQNYLYLAEGPNSTVEKYTLSGQLVTSWTAPDGNLGKFSPNDITVDSQDNVYLTDTTNFTLQKFTGDGQLLKSLNPPIPSIWQTMVSHSPLMVLLKTIKVFSTIDTESVIFRTPLQSFLFRENYENPSLFLFNPKTVAIDSQDNLYVGAAFAKPGISKYFPDGRLSNEWGSYGSQPEQLHNPMGIARDQQGNLYVADSFNHRVSKFTADGKFLKQWGKLGNAPGEFFFPLGIAVDTKNQVYVVDGGNLRIQKFTDQGEFIKQWGHVDCSLRDLLAFASLTTTVPLGDILSSWQNLTCSYGEDSFWIMTMIATDQEDNVYVVDSGKGGIKKFTADGDWLATFEGEKTSEESLLFMLSTEVGNDWTAPLGITVNNHNQVYVTYIADDPQYCQLKQFTTDGQLVTDNVLKSDDKKVCPGLVSTDLEGNIYLLDDSFRLRKFTAAGQFITQWGEWGHNPGQFGGLSGITVSPDGDHLYTADHINNRIQVFNRKLFDVGKAIVVAGGRGESDELWNATQMVSNYAYSALVYQGFTRNTLYYLNAKIDLDLDSNPDTQEVDAVPTQENLRWAITEWANDADHLTLYLTDHGGDTTFSLNINDQLKSADLNDWLNTWQTGKAGRTLKIIYDACDSGSFLPHFIPPAGNSRLVITSSEAGQSAYFLGDGALSFSYWFWDYLFQGLGVATAFTETKNMLDFLQQNDPDSAKRQTPQLEANGNGIGNEPADLTVINQPPTMLIGNGTLTDSKLAPKIISVSPPQTINQFNTPVTIEAKVDETVAVTRVWGIVRSVMDRRPTAPATTVTSLPTFELAPAAENFNHWQANYSGFDHEGSYSLAIYASDAQGNTSAPKTTTVQIQNPLRHRAILIDGELSDNTHRTSGAYQALTYQGYTAADIYYLSNDNNTGADRDASTELDNLQSTFTTWLQANPTQDVIIYLAGVEVNAGVKLNSTEVLTFQQLDQWLDNLQKTLPGGVVVIYQGAVSNAIFTTLSPPAQKTRMVISSLSSAENECAYESIEQSLFAELFWAAVKHGKSTIHQVFKTTMDTMPAALIQQLQPQLEADWKTTTNDKEDTIIANQFKIGMGILTAAGEPIVGEISATPELQGDTTTATISVKQVNTLNEIQTVSAEIYSPCAYQTPVNIIELSPTGNGGYQGRYDGFRDDGNYLVVIHAQDNQGNKSLPKLTWVHQRLPLISTQTTYHQGDHIQIKLPSVLTANEEQYLAVQLPDGSIYAITDLNQFIPLGATVPIWSGTGTEVIDLTITETIPKGEYYLYLVRLPKGTPLTLPPAPALLRQSGYVIE